MYSRQTKSHQVTKHIMSFQQTSVKQGSSTTIDRQCYAVAIRYCCCCCCRRRCRPLPPLLSSTAAAVVRCRRRCRPLPPPLSSAATATVIRCCCRCCLLPPPLSSAAAATAAAAVVHCRRCCPLPPPLPLLLSVAAAIAVIAACHFFTWGHQKERERGGEASPGVIVTVFVIIVIHCGCCHRCRCHELLPLLLPPTLLLLPLSLPSPGSSERERGGSIT